MKLKKTILREYLKTLKTSGTVTKSSDELCRKMISHIDFTKDLKICEFGPGEGTITHFILDAMNENSVLKSYELNSFFCDMMRKNIDDKRFQLIEDSVGNLDKYELENGKVDVILSSIPFAILPKELKEVVMTSCKRIMHKDSIYIQYHYSPFHKKNYKKIFSEVNVSMVPFNLPPAFVYVCKL